MLNWQALISDGCGIKQTNIQIPQDAKYLWTPWYTNIEGVPREFCDVDALPLSISDAAKNTEVISRHNVQNIYSSVEVNLEIPAYQLPENMALILDGNHRIVSAMIEGRSITIRLWTLSSPLEEQILPDLKHWGPNKALQPTAESGG